MVAVKVQYPGAAAAVRADLQNFGMLVRLIARLAPELDAKDIAEEVRERISEELDFELEAANQRALARLYREHPFILVPDVISSHSSERVLVSEYVQGIGFEELKRRPQDQRNRLGEIIFRFYFGCMYRHHQFSGDPHPGNFLLLDDGRVAFLDFGLFKRIDASVAIRARARPPSDPWRHRWPAGAAARRRLPARREPLHGGPDLAAILRCDLVVHA